VKDILIASFDMEIGGVERSLINMLEQFDYKSYRVDLMLYRHKGDFLRFLPCKPNLLDEMDEYTIFRKSIGEIVREGKILPAMARIAAKLNAGCADRLKGVKETGYYQMQLMWKYSLPFLPRLNNKYDAAISFLWPHYFVAEKVSAEVKIAWIHTDYSVVGTNTKMDFKMWNKFDHIIAVSEVCKDAFEKRYPGLKGKVTVIENITAPEFVRKMASEEVNDFDISNKCFNLITVARLSFAKGIDNAVKALKLLHDRGMKDIKWYVAGYGGDEGAIRGLIAEYGLEESFILLGKKVNPYPYVKKCDLYVQPSRYEGKAVTVVEAQILGKPVLVTDYATARSQVRNGFDGYITENSVEGIAEGVEKLYRNRALREKLASNCQRTDYGNSFELNKLYALINNSNNNFTGWY